MVGESIFSEQVWNTWLEPFQAVRLLMEAGLDDREQAVNWLKGNLRRCTLRTGGLHIKPLPNELIKCEWVYALYESDTWTHVAAIPWKDDFWISGNYEPDDPLDAVLRKVDREEFQHYLSDVRFEPGPIENFCRKAAGRSTAKTTEVGKTFAKGGRPPKAFWDHAWAAIAAQLYNGDLKPKRQADIERAMLDWIAAHDEEAGETAVRAKAKLLWTAIQTEVEN